MAGDTCHHCVHQQLDIWGRCLNYRIEYTKTGGITRPLMAVTSAAFTLFKGFGIRQPWFDLSLAIRSWVTLGKLQMFSHL